MQRGNVSVTSACVSVCVSNCLYALQTIAERLDLESSF